MRDSATAGPPARERSGRPELERSLGLGAATSVGLGTMIGAGIFVFPGIASGQAGPAATLSFALGAVIALLVALPASELATAMPRTGGGYYFVSRGLGASWGAVVGLGQWVGLIFAAAFYLVGAGHYLSQALGAVGVSVPISPSWIGFVVAVVLVVVSLLGTRKAGALQSAILVALLVVLATAVGYGLSVRFGLLPGPEPVTGPFAPYGVLPVFTTAAMVFTSYLGFAQIAAVAGEIRNPGRNVPWAMLGSVVLVGVLYVVTLVVANSFFTAERLGELGETAMVQLARELAGPVGAAVFLTGGVLATLSSANASVLSSSRSIFALGRDKLVPPKTGAVNARFRTPHVALLLAGVPMAALTLLGRLDLLAEVASLLHLTLYGLLCFALVALRRRAPASYRPTFRCPGYPAVPVLGGVASLLLIAFMQPASQLVGGGILVGGFIWYRVYASDVKLKETDL